MIGLAWVVLLGLGVWKRRELHEAVWMISLHSSTTDLPRCDRVEVFHLDPFADADAGFSIRRGKSFARIIAQRTLQGSEAEDFAQLWRSQTFATTSGQYQAMCHDPAFGLRFYRGSLLQFETTVCFGCGNFSLTAWDRSGFWGFDIGTIEGIELLETLLNLFPDSATPEERKLLEILKEFHHEP